jgi:hypothetical protein
MDREQVIATVSATGFRERMAEDFALWLNAAYADPNKPSSGYYVLEGDGFRYLEGETHETQDGRMKALDEADGGAWAVARFWLGVYAQRVEADHDAEDQLEVSTVAILLP